MPTQPSKDHTARDSEAQASAGRAAGYCWVEHPAGGPRCTRLPGHYPRLRHKAYYFRDGEEYD